MATEREIRLVTDLVLEAPPEQLWPLLSDTDRANRMMGLPASEQVEPNPDMSRNIRGHFLGIPVQWADWPFEWVFEQWFESARTFALPVPVTRLRTLTRLERLPENHTRVHVEIYATPRRLLGTTLFGVLATHLVIAQKFLRDMRRVYLTLGKAAINSPNELPSSTRPTVNAERLQRSMRPLQQAGARPELIERLHQHLSIADDQDVLKMRPFVLADRWNEPRLDVLRLFLYATRQGLLDMEWDVICPNCRGPSVRTPSLGNLAHDAHCPTCNVRYDVNFDESVELRFSVNPALREATDISFCVGGPANTRHIVSQLWLAPNGTRQVTLRIEPGIYRLRSPQVGAHTYLHVEPERGVSELPIGVRDDFIDMPGEQLRAGAVTLTLSNATDATMLVILEQSAWSAQAASAALVTALAEFRQLFSAEVLAPGLGLSVRSLTFLFSDLKGSTAIYEQIGDSPAFARVRDHFDVMRRIIADHRGALVKTIGDAVMAVFTMADDAVAASLEIQKEFTEGQISRGNPSLKVKLGLHSGPCIAVNANNLLDYFGSTVNIAARVQNESIGDDIVVTPEVLHDPRVQAMIQAANPIIESFTRELKGFRQSFHLTRLWVTDPAMIQAAEQQREQAAIPG